MSKHKENNQIQSEGGIARARSLSSEKRSEIAKKAAIERWNATVPVAESEGTLQLGDQELACVVLPDETRVISQATFLGAIGRSRSFRGGTGVSSTKDSAPFFLQAELFKPYAQDIASMPVKPIEYRTKNGKRAVGYNALLLPRVAELYLKVRDGYLGAGLHMPGRIAPYVKASDILIRGLADVGIIALIDEATGYQDKRAKDALARILEEFVAKELRPWIKTFPDDFYENLFRLRKLSYTTLKKKPQYFGTLTNEIVYQRLAPGVLAALKEATPRDGKGRPKNKLHQRLTDDIGHPALQKYLEAVTALMKISPDYKVFLGFLDMAYPKYNDNLQLPLGDRAESISTKANSPNKK